ncbi:hypothetical protein KC19_11G004300 [Ceratodon purpureus]|uniref:Uncharacterized protein n=1 Tax=Ceratodon purpureus TaxID=3225 RepID=A0A8T0G9E3_CERPU|nr:hypothetical protein KC19_11G004300 [Ceratodon purpureus]
MRASHGDIQAQPIYMYGDGTVHSAQCTLPSPVTSKSPVGSSQGPRAKGDTHGRGGTRIQHCSAVQCSAVGESGDGFKPNLVRLRRTLPSRC